MTSSSHAFRSRTLLDLIPPRGTDATRSLVLVGTVELASQALERITILNPHLSVELEQSTNQASGMADVTVATVQTLAQERRLLKFNPDYYKVVIVDEAGL